MASHNLYWLSPAKTFTMAYNYPGFSKSTVKVLAGVNPCRLKGVLSRLSSWSACSVIVPALLFEWRHLVISKNFRLRYMYGIGGFKLSTGYTNKSLFGLHAHLKLSMQRLTTFDKSVPLLYNYNTIWQKNQLVISFLNALHLLKNK